MVKKLAAVLAVFFIGTVTFSGCEVINETFRSGSASSESTPVVSDISEEDWISLVDEKQIPQMDGIETVKITDWEENYLIYAVYPNVIDKSDISADIAEFVENKIELFKNEVQSNQGDMDGKTKPELSIEYEPYAYEDALISFKVTTNANSGVTRTDGFITTFVYSMATESRLSLDDVFDSSMDYASIISNLVRSKLENNSVLQSNYDAALFEAGTAPNKNNFSDFVIGDGEVIFYFNANRIAPSAAGSFEVSLSFDELGEVLMQDILHPDARVTVNAATGEQLPDFLIAGEEDMSAFSIEGIDPSEKVVALTFDDGPNPSTTEQILDALEQYDAVATFFVLGERAADYPEVVRKIYENGNEIGNHSYDHADFKQISTESLHSEIDRTNQAIYDAVGAHPIIVRPPYGSINDSIAEEIGRACILWTVDPEDWKNRDTEIDYNNVMNVVQDGDIVLMHDIYQETADAAVQIIKDLKSQGYKFVTVSQMMQISQARGNEPELIVRNGARYNNE
jgi:polysaccharide deacetylase family sporulation protein PdaB